jgi:gamma-glutamyl phosphate reductase
MLETNKLLETEAAIQELLSELEKIKAASEQIEDAQNNAQVMEGMAENIIQQTVVLVEKNKEILHEIQEIRLSEKLETLLSLSNDKFEEVLKTASGVVDNGKIMVENQSSLKESISKRSWIFGILGIVVIALQAWILVAHYLA